MTCANVSSRLLRVADLETEVFLDGHDKLERIDRIEPKTLGAEDRHVVPDFVGFDIEHQLLYHHFLDFLPQFRSV